MHSHTYTDIHVCVHLNVKNRHSLSSFISASSCYVYNSLENLCNFELLLQIEIFISSYILLFYLLPLSFLFFSLNKLHDGVQCLKFHQII